MGDALLGTVAITGASGLIGRALRARLEAAGSRVVAFVRRREQVQEGSSLFWNPAAEEIDSAGLEALAPEAVVHLAGESIAGKRWSPAFRRRLLDSRAKGTRLVAEALAAMPEDKRPRVFVSASGSGYYGDTGARVVDESEPAGASFLAEICVAWEGAADAARQAGIRVVHPRFGVVLSREGGALQRMLLPFRLALGGRLGSGRQFFPYVSLEDAVSALMLLLTDARAEGPINVVAPQAVTNQAFTKALGRALGRPTIIPVPGAALKLALGSEMATELLLGGQGVSPKQLESLGFAWQHPGIDDALRAALS